MVRRAKDILREKFADEDRQIKPRCPHSIGFLFLDQNKITVMANKRMFSNNIINSARFLKMPAEAQSLYFHLCMRADDDGVVEAYPVMKITGTNEDNLRVLVAKEFVTILNEDDVAYINDWLEHNTIRADRKIDSQYKDLLLQIVPSAQIITPKIRADVAGRSTDGPRTTNGRHRLDQIRLDLVIDKQKNEKKKYTPVAEFTPKSHEEFIAKGIAEDLGEKHINFVLSATRKFGAHTVQRAYDYVKETPNVEDKRKLFNAYVQKETQK